MSIDDYRFDPSSGALLLAPVEPIERSQLPARDEEIGWLLKQAEIDQRKDWALVNGRLVVGKWASRDRLTAMAQASYSVLGAQPLPVSLAALTTTTTEQGLIPAADIQSYTPLPPNPQTPQQYRVVINGLFTSPASTGTLTITPRLGNANTSPSLGASGALAQTSSLTNASFGIQGDVVLRAPALPGANAPANGSFDAFLNTAVNGAQNTFGWGTNGTVNYDASLTAPGANGGGLWIGMTGATAFPAYTVQQILLISWD